MPCLKIDIQKVQYLKQCQSYFFRFYQAYKFFVETKDAIYVLLSSKSARNPGHYRLFVSTGTRPGQMQKFRDCPGHSGTLGNYATIGPVEFVLIILYSSGQIFNGKSNSYEPDKFKR